MTTRTRNRGTALKSFLLNNWFKLVCLFCIGVFAFATLRDTVWANEEAISKLEERQDKMEEEAQRHLVDYTRSITELKSEVIHLTASIEELNQTLKEINRP